MKDKMVYKGNNVVRALMNAPIFVGTFSVVTDFAVLEDMDASRDEGIGDVIVGEPFLREVEIKAKRFDRIITIYNGNDEVTYQMVRSHPRFKNHTNEQCNEIPPLLKVSEKDEQNGILHAHQKLKGFYKGVLNLGLDYILNAKTKEWLTHRHLEICTLQMGMYISSQNSCDFTTVTINGESEERRTNEGIIWNYYDREDGETTLRFEV
ncbi:hypothetical protein Tco_1394841 [Tanacetum coccineum]